MPTPKFHIEWMDQHGYWKHYQTKHNQADTFRVMKRRAEATGKRHRMIDDAGNLLDIVSP